MASSPTRQLKSSFVRPFSIPGAPTNPQSKASKTTTNVGFVNETNPTSYAESLLYHKSFYFQQRRGDLDLRGISRVDVDKIIRETDIDTLQSFLENITFSDVSSDDLKLYSDECFIRLFQITQLTLEYLLNVQVCSRHFRRLHLVSSLYQYLKQNKYLTGRDLCSPPNAFVASYAFCSPIHTGHARK